MKASARWILLASGLAVTVMAGCRPQIALEERIRARVLEDAPALATMEAVYGITFLNEKERWLGPDDFYLRKDRARVLYGYRLDAARITVDRSGAAPVLRVRLPEPERISVDRKAAAIVTPDEDYRPEGPDGRPLDVDAEMSARLERALDRHERRSLEGARQLSRRYFETLARRHGLELDLVFAGPASGS